MATAASRLFSSAAGRIARTSGRSTYMSRLARVTSSFSATSRAHLLCATGARLLPFENGGPHFIRPSDHVWKSDAIGMVYAVTAFRRVTEITRRPHSPGDYTLKEKEIPDSPGLVAFQGSGFAVEEYPGRVFTASHVVANVKATAAATKVHAHEACQVYVTPLMAYGEIQHEDRNNPQKLALAGGVRVSGYRSLQPPVRDMAAQCVMREIDPDTARTRWRLLGIDVAVLDLECPPPSWAERGRQPYRLAMEEVTVEAADGKTALVFGLPNGTPSYVGLGPPPDLCETTFPGSSISRCAEMIDPKLACLEGLSGGPVIIPPEGEGPWRAVGAYISEVEPLPGRLLHAAFTRLNEAVLKDLFAQEYRELGSWWYRREVKRF